VACEQTRKSFDALFLFEVKIVLNVLRIFEFKMVEISLTTTALKVRHTIYIYLIRHFNVDIVSLYIFQVKIQMMSKNLQGYYTLKCLIRDLLSNVFVSPKF